MKMQKVTFVAVRIKNKPMKVDFFTKKGTRVEFKRLTDMPKSVQVFLKKGDWERIKKFKREIVIR